MNKYNPNIIEPKWIKKWEKWKLYEAVDPPEKGSEKPKKYLLIEFPYPSGERLHVGHGRSYCCLDAMARLSRMKGFNVLYPIGWDAFGLPAENYAIKTGINPQITTAQNVKNAKAQAKSWGLSFDWSREINTTDPNYYKWTQWIFIQLFKKGLAYKADVPVNWCPKCKTNLADEEVLADGTHERCGEKTEKRMQKQWLIKITAYAERLLKDLDLVNFREDIKRQQINWIGKSEGAEVEFRIYTRHAKLVSASNSNYKGTLKPSKKAGRQIRNDAFITTDDFRIKVFTTRLDTIFGATFLVLAPEHPLIEKLKPLIPKERKKEVEKYIKNALNKSELERISEGKEKTGVFTGLHAINPFTNEKIPIWIGDFVVKSYGTGAIMGVPAHDKRDFAFAKKYGLKIKEVIKPEKGKKREEVYTDYGILVNSGKYSGLTSKEAIKSLLKYLKENHLGQESVQYHLRDWVFSRQHYWGEPIPMVYCPECAKKGASWWETKEGKEYLEKNSKFQAPNSKKSQDSNNQNSKSFENFDFEISKEMVGWFPVPEEELPVELPYVEKYQPSGTGESPLAKVKEWVNTRCPNCGGPAKRETDTMPNWAGSNWYFLGYLIAKKLKTLCHAELVSASKLNYKGIPKQVRNEAFKVQDDKNKSRNIFADNKDLLKYWLPIDLYNGGMEHTTLHLLYSRFIYKFLYDLGLVPTPEPYARRWSHGVVLGPDGQKMSKSKGNVINPDDIVKKYGADTFRLYEAFMGPFEQMIAWDEKGVKGCFRFLNRVWDLTISKIFMAKSDSEGGNQNEVSHPELVSGSKRLWSLIYKTTKKVETDIWHLSFNTAIASLMELLNAFYAQKDEVTLAMLKHYLLLLAPFAPFITEELWNEITCYELRVTSYDTSIHSQPWPSYKEELLAEEEITIVIQVNGKLRDTMITRRPEIGDQKKIEKLAINREKIAKYLKGRKIKKVIYVKGKLINFVV